MTKYRITCESLDGSDHTIKSSTKMYTHAGFIVVNENDIIKTLWCGYSSSYEKAKKNKGEHYLCLSKIAKIKKTKLTIVKHIIVDVERTEAVK
ncbi:MAG: hypothetical protein OQL19_18210 [Gammaproteobacteria bacterium]|nr:hypothetical protein [Gammaproteobacteria bacterium]